MKPMQGGLNGKSQETLTQLRGFSIVETVAFFSIIREKTVCEAFSGGKSVDSAMLSKDFIKDDPYQRKSWRNEERISSSSPIQL